ncbi:uncharacterized protein TNCV_2114431 [Trichonephila clavipes]|nr:uncharacterized protein TNCV_2114431 [Trichonephila clavipes]
MACEIKLLESETTTGFFVLLGEQGNKAVLDWVMKEGLIPSRYECPKCKKGMRLVERKGTIDGFEWRCRVQSKENPYFVCRSVRKGMWFSHSRLSICVILRLTRIDKIRAEVLTVNIGAPDLQRGLNLLSNTWGVALKILHALVKIKWEEMYWIAKISRGSCATENQNGVSLRPMAGGFPVSGRSELTREAGLKK